MTYNLLGMSPGSEPEVRILHIIDNLIELDPDIIGLQEINESLTAGGIDNQAKVIADSLSSYFGIPYYYYYEFTHLAWWDQFREFVGIISKYPVEETGYRQLTAGVFPRKVVWNKINTPIGTVNVFTTHLSAFNLWEIRIQQVQQIISFVDSIEFQHPVIASILTGDFNDPPDSTSIQQLTNTGTDTFYVMTYAYVNPTDPGYTVPSNQPTSKIDYVFIKNTGGLEPFESTVVMKEPYAPGKFCSDHLGVLTSFREGVLHAEDDSFIQPMEIELFQNYPNPFNPTTVIKYQVPELSFVTIKVYDVLGNDVAILVKEEKTAGSYEVRFDGTRLTSGVYFYTMRVNNFIDTKKIMLIK
jgi:endonuclease/exonuclease/phosphatase family metal-dependent hydrolase